MLDLPFCKVRAFEACIEKRFPNTVHECLVKDWTAWGGRGINRICRLSAKNVRYDPDLTTKELVLKESVGADRVWHWRFEKVCPKLSVLK